MIRLLYRSKASAAKAAQAIKEFDIQNVKHQLMTAEDFINNQLKDLKSDTAIEGIKHSLNSREVVWESGCYCCKEDSKAERTGRGFAKEQLALDGFSLVS